MCFLRFRVLLPPRCYTFVRPITYEYTFQLVVGLYEHTQYVNVLTPYVKVTQFDNLKPQANNDVNRNGIDYVEVTRTRVILPVSVEPVDEYESNVFDSPRSDQVDEGPSRM